MLYKIYEVIAGIQYTVVSGLTETQATTQLAQLREQLAYTNLQRESEGLQPISSYGMEAQ